MAKKRAAKAPTKRKTSGAAKTAVWKACHVVVIGASAGGLEALADDYHAVSRHLAVRCLLQDCQCGNQKHRRRLLPIAEPEEYPVGQRDGCVTRLLKFGRVGQTGAL